MAPCPRCGAEVELFKDDRSRKCPRCGTRFRNPHIDLGCAKWCPFAAECIDYRGDEAEESIEPPVESPMQSGLGPEGSLKVERPPA